MRGKFALFFAIFCVGISNLIAQETAKWKAPAQIKISQLSFYFTQKDQFEVEKDILFSDKGIKIAASKQAATLISKKTEVPLQCLSLFWQSAAPGQSRQGIMEKLL